MIKTIYLMLGPACNMSCRHCSQNEYKLTYSLTPRGKEISNELLGYLKDLHSQIDKCTIYFWGGEPLLFWEAIKKAVLLLEKNGLTKFNYYLYTNGLLLNDEIVDFCEKHRFFIAMSYDAPNPTALRGDTPSDYACECFKKFNGPKRINSVFTAQNSDLVACEEYIAKLFPNIKHTIGHFMCLTKTSLLCMDFTPDEIRRQVTRYLDSSPKGEKWGATKLIKATNFDDDKFAKEFYPMCNHGKTVQALDMEGNCYACHNASIIIGHIRDGKETLQERYKKCWLESRIEKCLTCEIRNICQCRCPFEYKQGDEYASCQPYKEMILAIISHLKSKNIIE